MSNIVIQRSHPVIGFDVVDAAVAASTILRKPMSSRFLFLFWHLIQNLIAIFENELRHHIDTAVKSSRIFIVIIVLIHNSIPVILNSYATYYASLYSLVYVKAQGVGREIHYRRYPYRDGYSEGPHHWAVCAHTKHK